MSKRADLLFANSLGNRWQATATTVGATVSVSSPVIRDVTSKPHMDGLWYSFQNQMGAGALISTVSLQVRHASPTGTLIAALDHLLPVSTSANVVATGLNIAGKAGGRLNITTSTFIASVQASVNAFGWIEDTNG